MSAYNQRSWGSRSGDQPFSVPSIRVLPTCRQEATPYLLPSAPSRAHLSRPALSCPAIPCSAPSGGALLRDGPAGLYPVSLVSRDSRKPLGSCFWSYDPRGDPWASVQKGLGGRTAPCSLALLVQQAAPHPNPHRGLLSRQIKHFINCILNTCFKLVRHLSSFLAAYLKLWLLVQPWGVPALAEVSCFQRLRLSGVLGLSPSL